MARLPTSVLNTAAFTYLGFRAAFVVLYVNGTTSTHLTFDVEAELEEKS
jgi:hypothetical protein